MLTPIRSALRRVAEGGVEMVAAFNRRRLAKAGDAFLVGIHAPMRAELTLTELEVSGAIPPGLNGRYLRMGANPAKPDPAGHHWFLGDGMVHGLALQGGRALWYRNRWILSRLAAAALGRPPAPGPRRGRNDTVNTNIIDIGGRAVAVVEAGSFPVERQRYNPFEGTLGGAFSGHPHRDTATGAQHAIAYDGNIWDSVRHVVVDAGGRVVRDEAVAVADGPCVHDCGLTARFAIILDLPVTFSMRAVLRGHVFPYRWNPGHQARVGLLPRDGTGDEVIWCEMEPCFVFHVANAFDRADGLVVLDVIAYDTMFATALGGLDALGRFERWTLDPVRRSVARVVVDATPQEFPRIDDRRFGQAYRYAYTVAVPPDGNTQLAGATRIYKHDLVAGTREEHDFGGSHVPGEFIFVPAHADAGEDEGWLMGLVIDTATSTTALVILEARGLGTQPVASVRLNHVIPPGFHGNWFAGV